MTERKRTEKRKAPLTPQRIVSAAVRLADERGIDLLTMRSLADHLETGPMSLYNHVADKDDLIDEMVDHVAAEIELPPADTPWKQATRALAVATHQALQQHPWAIAPWAARMPGPNRYDLMEVLLDHLFSARLPPDIADMGFHAITNHLQSFAQRGDNQPAPDDYALFHRDIDLQRFPRVVQHVQFHQAGHATRDEFVFVLDLILDGLERMGETA